MKIPEEFVELKNKIIFILDVFGKLKEFYHEDGTERYYETILDEFKIRFYHNLGKFSSRIGFTILDKLGIKSFFEIYEREILGKTQFSFNYYIAQEKIDLINNIFADAQLKGIFYQYTLGYYRNNLFSANLCSRIQVIKGKHKGETGIIYSINDADKIVNIYFSSSKVFHDFNFEEAKDILVIIEE